MAFLKVGTFVINTAYIAAVNLESKTLSGEDSVSIWVAIPKFLGVETSALSPNFSHCEWIEFTGKEAQVLQDYFSSYNNVVDLLPTYQETPELSHCF